MNEKKYEFDAVIKKVPDIDGAYVEFPFDVRQEFGRGRVKVHALFDGAAYDGSLVRMQTPGHIIGLRKENSREIRYMLCLRKGSERDNFVISPILSVM